MTDTPTETVEQPVVKRTTAGQFIKGQSGNPAGRTKGTKNRITIARLMLEEGLRDTLGHKGPALLEKAIQMAMKGNDKIMRVLLDKMLATPKGEDGENARDTEITVNVHNLTRGAPAQTVVEAQSVNLKIPKESQRNE